MSEIDKMKIGEMGEARDLTGYHLNESAFNTLLNEIKTGQAKGTYQSSDCIYYKNGNLLVKYSIKSRGAYILSDTNSWVINQELSQVLNNNINAFPREYNVFESYPMNDREEIITNALLGFAVGDALGVPVEFLGRDSVKNYDVKAMLGHRAHNVPEGTWSDDTSLTIAAMDSIIRCGDIDYDDIMKSFASWSTHGEYTATGETFDVGMTTLKAITNYDYRGFSPLECGPKGFSENGNGSLMRMIPFVFYINTMNLDNEAATTVINNASSLTHAHEISKLGCKIYSDFMLMLINGMSKEVALEALSKMDYQKYYSIENLSLYKRILDGTIKDATEDEIKSSGYVVDSLEAAIWTTMTSNTYEESVLKAIYLGGDTDTIAAIAGSMNGIIYGKNAIPSVWLSKLRRKDYLEQLAQNYAKTLESLAVKK